MIPSEPVRGSIPPPWFCALPGIERVRAFSHRLLPSTPLGRLMGIRTTHVGAGSGTWTMPASPTLVTATGVLEITSLIESALLAAATTAVPAGVEVVPLTLGVNHFRPSRPEAGNFLARARVANLSSLFVFTEVEVEDPQGRQIAHATSQGALRTLDPPPPPPPHPLRPVDEPVYATPDPHLRPTRGAVPSDVWEKRGGLAVLQMLAKGELPPSPSFDLLGITLVQATSGTVTMTMPASEWFCLEARRVASGVVGSLLTHASGYATLTLLPRGRSHAWLEWQLRFYRPVPPDGRTLTAEATAVRRDPDLVVSDGRVLDPDGALVASASGTAAILEGSQRQRAKREPRRILATLLFTDIVGSTEHVKQLGDVRWRVLLDEHRDIVRTELARAEGVEVQTIGDGFLVRFDSPARALECARAIRDGVRRVGIEVRAGVHTGECELQGAELAGIAVHIAARIGALAAPSEVLVSRTVRDLVAGSGMTFVDRGVHALKGVPDEWQLFAVTSC